MARILSNNGERNSNNWTRRIPKGAFVPKFPNLSRRSVRTLGKVDPNTGQGSPYPRSANLLYAALTTALTGANNDLTLTAKFGGTGGNSIRLALVNPGGTAARSVSVSGNDITVNLAVTAGAINATETASSIAASINANAQASALVTAAVKAGDDGTGVVTALALTALSGGTEQFSEPGTLPGEGSGARVMGTQASRIGTVGGTGGGAVKRVRNRGVNRTLKKR